MGDDTTLGQVLLFCKDRPHVDRAILHLKPHCRELLVFKGLGSEPFPSEALNYSPDVILSYISSWIIPAELLGRTSRFALNFHPGPPEYPGTGCTNFALYHEAKSYGVTAHHLEKTIDSGPITGVKRFPIDAHDTVQSVTMRCYDALIELFCETLDYMVEAGEPPKSNETWARKAYTRKELNELCRIDPDMSEDEVKRRVRATTFPGKPGAFVEIAGMRFEYVGESR